MRALATIVVGDFEVPMSQEPLLPAVRGLSFDYATTRGLTFQLSAQKIDSEDRLLRSE